jgi:hypothetical protein
VQFAQRFHENLYLQFLKIFVIIIIENKEGVQKMEPRIYVTYKLYNVWNTATFHGFSQYINWQSALRDMVAEFCGADMFQIISVYDIDENTLR